MVRYGVPASYVVFGLLALALPLVRLYARTGRFGFVAHRGRDPRAMVMGAALVVLVLGGALWCAALVAWGPAALGIAALPTPVHAVGLGVCGLGIAVCALAQAQMGASWRIGIGDEATALVSSGLYAWTRHPIYTALLTYAAGIVLAAPSLGTAGAFVLAAVAVELEARLEEQHLLAQHGDAYRAYAARVGRFLPWFGRL